LKKDSQQDNQRVKRKNDHPAAGQEKGPLDFEKIKGREKVKQDNDKKTQQIGAEISQVKFNEMDFAKRRIQSGFQARCPFCCGAVPVERFVHCKMSDLKTKYPLGLKGSRGNERYGLTAAAQVVLN